MLHGIFGKLYVIDCLLKVLIFVQAKLGQMGLKGKDAFGFFLSEDNSSVVTLQEFEQGLQQVGLKCSGPYTFQISQVCVICQWLMYGQ